MEPLIIPDDDGKGFTIASVGTDVEHVDPIKYLADRTIATRKAVYTLRLKLSKTAFPADAIEKVATKNANEDWEKHLAELKATEVPAGLVTLLGTATKREQVKLFRSISLTPESLWAFIFTAWAEHGFTYSSYHIEVYPKGTDVNAMPKLATLDPVTGQIKKVGPTGLTDGQIKAAITQRSVTSTHFLDRGAEWHCLFITYNSIGGKESWGNGQAHYHYISDKFGIPREEAVARFKSGNYPTTSVHIPLLGYGNQGVDPR